VGVLFIRQTKIFSVLAFAILVGKLNKEHGKFIKVILKDRSMWYKSRHAKQQHNYVDRLCADG